MSALFRARAVDVDALYRNHAPTVYRYAYAVLGNQADAEDVTQQTFLNAFRAIERGTKPRKAENWLLRIAHNEVRRHFRKNGTRSEVGYRDDVAEEALEPIEPSLADVLRALRRLPPAQREALVMREFEGRSYAEMAAILEISQSALEALLFRARRGLAEELEDALTCTEAKQSISRRLDGRLPRRESRRLKEHLHACGRCVSFATIQKRQRSLLKGLSIMPIPASLFLFRGEHAAAAGLGGSAVAAGSGAGASVVVAKAAAVTAAVAVTGGVGYGVATEQGPAPKATPKAALAASPVSPTPRPAASRTARDPQARALPISASKTNAAKAKPKNVKARVKKRLVGAGPSALVLPTKLRRQNARPAIEKPERVRPERAERPEREPKSKPPRRRGKPTDTPPKPEPRGKKPPAPAAEEPPPKKPKT